MELSYPIAITINAAILFNSVNQLLFAVRNLKTACVCCENLSAYSSMNLLLFIQFGPSEGIS